jgi:hypothetical protein
MQACKQLAIFFCDLKKLPSGVESKKAYIDLLIERNVPFMPYDEFEHMVREATRKQRSPGFKALNWSVYYARFTTDFVFGRKKVDAKANNDSFFFFLLLNNLLHKRRTTLIQHIAGKLATILRLKSVCGPVPQRKTSTKRE